MPTSNNIKLLVRPVSVTIVTSWNLNEWDDSRQVEEPNVPPLHPLNLPAARPLLSPLPTPTPKNVLLFEVRVSVSYVVLTKN